MVDAVDYQRFVDKWDDNIKKAKNGILFFDNVQKLLPDKYSSRPTSLSSRFWLTNGCPHHLQNLATLRFSL